MGYEAGRRQRRSIRLKGYDYCSSGVYCVTICINDRACLLGAIVGGEAILNAAGSMVQETWSELTHHYAGVETDAFVVMPNHVHGIIVLTGCSVAAPTLSVPEVVQRYKMMTTKRYADGVKASNWPAFCGRLWQRNYYEHIVRSDTELERLRRYIAENPLRWADDQDDSAWVPGRGSTAGASPRVGW